MITHENDSASYVIPSAILRSNFSCGKNKNDKVGGGGLHCFLPNLKAYL